MKNIFSSKLRFTIFIFYLPGLFDFSFVFFNLILTKYYKKLPRKLKDLFMSRKLRSQFSQMPCAKFTVITINNFPRDVFDVSRHYGILPDPSRYSKNRIPRRFSQNTQIDSHSQIGLTVQKISFPDKIRDFNIFSDINTEAPEISELL